MINKAGMYKARASKAQLSKVGQNETPAIQVVFRIVGGEFDGHHVRWDGWLTTDKAQKRTLESLDYCGWHGDDLSAFSDGNLFGLDKNEVELDVQMEEYEDSEGNTKKAAKVAWVNRIGGAGINVENAMSKGDAASFASKMKGLVHMMRSKKPANAAPSSTQSASSDDTIPF